MGEFEIYGGKLKTSVNDEKKITGALRQVGYDISDVRRKLDLNVLSSNQEMKKHLKYLENELQEELSTINQMSVILTKVIYLYESTEKEICKENMSQKAKSKGCIYEIVYGKQLLDFIEKKSGIRIMSWETDSDGGLKWDWSEDTKGLFGKKSGSFSLIELFDENEYRIGDWKLGGRKSQLGIGNLDGGLEGGIGIVKDGKISPGAFIVGTVSGSLLSLETERQIGPDELNHTVKAKGDLIGGEAKGKVGLGFVEVQDENGNKRKTFGGGVELGAEAYVAKGEIHSGYNIFGIKVDVKLEGTYESVGVKYKSGIYKDGLEIGGSGALGAGAGVYVTLDWSDLFD